MGEDAVDVGDPERPLEGELQPSESTEQSRRISCQVVVKLCGVPTAERHQRRREEAAREDALRHDQWRREGDDDGEDDAPIAVLLTPCIASFWVFACFLIWSLLMACVLGSNQHPK